MFALLLPGRMLYAIPEKPKLHLYSKVKSDWGVASHVRCNLSKFKRSLITQLRLGMLGIEVEVGRYNCVLKEERVCKLCKLDVEDEIHFLFECRNNNIHEKFSKVMLKVPELSSNSDYFSMIMILSEKTYIFGNYINDLWYDRRVTFCNVK